MKREVVRTGDVGGHLEPGVSKPWVEKDNSNSASAQLSRKVTSSVVTCAPDIDVTVSARTPSEVPVASFYGQDKKKTFLAVVRTLDQIPTRDEKGNKAELLSRAMSVGRDGSHWGLARMPGVRRSTMKNIIGREGRSSIPKDHFWIF